MNPEVILSETPGNRAIDNSQISAINIKVHDMLNRNLKENEFKIIIESAQGKIEYIIPQQEQFTAMLKDVYGERLHMPFGYISAFGVRGKLF
jgi:hypothetical protein